MKDYLNTNEVTQMVIVGHLMDKVDDILTEWNERKNLTAEEHKAFKTSLTWGLKAWEQILNRQNIRTAENIDKRIHQMSIRFTDDFQEKILERKLNEKLNTAQEREQNFYDLVEIVMDKNCKNCKNCGAECELFSLFVNNFVAEPSGEHFEGKHCKYAYEGKQKNLKK